MGGRASAGVAPTVDADVRGGEQRAFAEGESAKLNERKEGVDEHVFKTFTYSTGTSLLNVILTRLSLSLYLPTQGLAVGADDFLSMPASRVALVAAIERNAIGDTHDFCSRRLAGGTNRGERDSLDSDGETIDETPPEQSPFDAPRSIQACFLSTS